ncbi:MAG: STAS domain-containing protein [Rhodothermaceae bacterium]|nr:STAS domain-containing protein [Rhodothermaceae bacterium]
MKTTITHQDSVAIIGLDGNLFGGSDSTAFCNIIADLLRRSSYKVVLDLANLNWISIAGTGLLMSALTAFRNHNGDIKLAAPSPEIQDILSRASFDAVFDYYDNSYAAVAAF